MEGVGRDLAKLSGIYRLDTEVSPSSMIFWARVTQNSTNMNLSSKSETFHKILKIYISGICTSGDLASGGLLQLVDYGEKKVRMYIHVSAEEGMLGQLCWSSYAWAAQLGYTVV